MKLKYLNYSEQKQLKINGYENHNLDKKFIALSVYDLESVFLLWCSGIIISGVRFLIEFRKYYHKNRRNR